MSIKLVQGNGMDCKTLQTNSNWIDLRTDFDGAVIWIEYFCIGYQRGSNNKTDFIRY